MLSTATTLSDYETLRTGAAIHPRPMAGVLQLTGDDRVDFLQRMSTNDIERPAVGQAVVTVLTNPMARTLFAFTVLKRADDLLLLPALGQTEVLADYLRRQIFYGDKVKVQDISNSLVRLRLMGPQAEKALGQTGVAVPAADSSFTEKDETLVLRQEYFDIPGFEILIAPSQKETLLTQLRGASATVIGDIPSLKARRVELGIPGVGRELTDAFTPLESGLGWACAEDKGCYTGQEIIARQITYDKVTKGLIGIRSERPLPEGATILVDGRNVGTVTSVAAAPAASPMALGIVKRPHNEAGTVVDVDGVPAQIVDLPFAE